nr:hypothetical protein [Tanacetum cinerariifolium]
MFPFKKASTSKRGNMVNLANSFDVLGNLDNNPKSINQMVDNGKSIEQVEDDSESDVELVYDKTPSFMVSNHLKATNVDSAKGASGP